MKTKALWFVALIIVVSFMMSSPALSLAASSGEVQVAATQFYHGWGPGWGPSPYWGAYPYYYYPDPTGKIKIKDANDTDQVYINGALAGDVDHMDSIHLNPGRYRVQVRSDGKEIVDREVFVVRGKTIKIRVGSEVED